MEEKRRNGMWIPVALIVAVVCGGVGYGELKGMVGENTKDLDNLDNIPVQMTAMQKDMEYMSKDFKEFKADQKQTNGKILDKLEELLEKSNVAQPTP